MIPRETRSFYNSQNGDFMIQNEPNGEALWYVDVCTMYEKECFEKDSSDKCI